MANGEWLTQLLSGLGGAFTGEVAARGRIAEEEEAKRKREELQAERDRLKRIQTLRQQPFSQETARQLLAEGETPSNIAGLGTLSRSFMPKEPDYSSKVVGQKGEVYFSEPGTGRSIRATDPTGQPLFERVPPPPQGPTERTLTPSQRSQGIGFLTSFFAEPGQTQEEKMRRSQLFTSLQQTYEDPSELGYALMQAERLRRKPTTTKVRPSINAIK
jgi:hypothetical protein